MFENRPRRTASSQRAQTLFDLRTIIAALFGIYGTVLTVMGAAGQMPAELRKAGGWNVNLWCGLGMLAFATAFGAWALLRPVSVPPAEADPDTRDTALARTG
ncbi:hypothetical protein [Streptomyces tropicalis]|uniref:Uncharacterized protein n=1 Tax=Streptomyces tropicalis TaxID=3034234 RepID=A0ABT6A6M9_9ACTN|nr:hypothetical protein [Streptomyces tropicalis]MDF3299465.1 hypothetical protein [Streptomyces tropicalis]